MEEQKKNIYYDAFRSKDQRFDGQFFVGITSTGIYCRPICSARLPRKENCHYFKTAAAAEQAGFRPCLLCRPELAPEKSIAATANTIASRAARLLKENCGSGLRLTELANRLGCTDRHLRRIFAEEYYVTPVKYMQTCRLLLAKNLLTDTQLSITEIAMAAGFGSLRRFNELFQKHYRMAPAMLRKELKQGKTKGGDITVGIGYRPPYDWHRMLAFLALRAIPGVELVQPDRYMRTIRLLDRNNAHLTGWIMVRNYAEKNVLKVTISESLVTVLPQLLARIKRLFDVYCDPESMYDRLSSMNTVKPGLYVKGMRVPGCTDPFEMAVRAVLGQQITIKAARTLAGRMAVSLGTPIVTDINGLVYVFPSAEKIMTLQGPIEDRLGPLGIIASRARTIRALAQAFCEGEIDCITCLDPEKEMKKLMELPGIGAWTAGYIAMRAIGWTDAFLETDYGIKQAMQPMTSREILQKAEDWHPWRSYAVMNIWNYVSEGGNKK